MDSSPLRLPRELYEVITASRDDESESSARARSASGLKRAKNIHKHLVEKRSFLGVPQTLFDEYNDEFHFTVDACSSHDNYKVDRHWTIKEDGLAQSWEGETLWIHPMYGRDTYLWVQKAFSTSRCTAVFLVPASTSSRYFRLVWDYAARPQRAKDGCEIRFIDKRLRFVSLKDGKAKNPASFDSMIIIIKRMED